MRYYETLYIVSPNFEQDRLKKIMEDVSSKINGKEVSIINHYVWNKKRLAYAIQKFKYGTFIILQFETDKVDILTEFEKYLRLSDSIIRHQTVRLDKKPEIHEDLSEELHKKETEKKDKNVPEEAVSPLEEKTQPEEKIVSPEEIINE